MYLAILLLAAVLAGCAPISQLYGGIFASAESCPTEKIQFAQDDGCLNDGSFEFCVINNPDLLIILHQTVPNISCIPSAGRARCDTQTQVLCIVSTDGLCSTSSTNALTDEGWQLVRNLAAQPYIEKIVATWYE